VGAGRRRKYEAGTVRPIRYLGDPVLRTECDPVTRFDADLRRHIDDMFASMYANDGAGLAANQIGLSLRVFVYDCADDERRENIGYIVNPVLVEADGELVDADEGCLSLPGLRFTTPRYARAVVEGVDAEGEAVRVEGTGYFARCLQHEAAHLNGHLYVDGLKGPARREAMRAVRSAEWS
jgi:peptide deformylase